VPSSVLSPKYVYVSPRSVGCFSRRSEPDWRYRRAYLDLIRKERATRKNSQLAAAQRVAMKMGRWLRCSSVTSRFHICPTRQRVDSIRSKWGGTRPLGASPARTALPRPILIATKHARISGTRPYIPARKYYIPCPLFRESYSQYRYRLCRVCGTIFAEF
jgi:hypothetical protein